MKRAVSIETFRWPCRGPLLCACALLVAGCASGAWLESPSEAELPLDPPTHGYPSAYLPGFESSVAPAQALPANSWQAPSTAAMTLPVASTASAATASVTSSEPVALQTKAISPTDLRARLDHTRTEFIDALEAEV